LLSAPLCDSGFAEGVYDHRPDDSLKLIDCGITNAVRCVPPQNKPTPAEINTCRRFLNTTIADDDRLEAVVALGRIAHESLLRAVGAKLSAHPFGHGAQHDLRLANGRSVRLYDSYHCSRYNTNTGVLTPKMFQQVFAAVRTALV